MSSDKAHNDPLKNPDLKQTIFEVPEGYFEELENNIMDEVSLDSGELQQRDLLKENIFDTPEGYFEELEENTLAEIAMEQSELAQNDHLKTPVFGAPEGFFDQLSDELMQKVGLDEPEEATKVIPLYQRNWFRFMTAAILILGFFGLRGLISTDPIQGVELADLNQEIIIDYLAEEDIINSDLLASVDDLEGILDNIIEDETSGFDFESLDNPELEYDFDLTDYE